MIGLVGMLAAVDYLVLEFEILVVCISFGVCVYVWVFGVVIDCLVWLLYILLWACWLLCHFGVGLVFIDLNLVSFTFGWGFVVAIWTFAFVIRWGMLV